MGSLTGIQTLTGVASITGLNTVSPALVLLSTNHATGTNATVNNLTSVPAGALIVMTTGTDLADVNCVVSSSPSLVWTKRVDSRDCSAEIWYAIFTDGGNIDVTCTWSGSGQSSSVAWVFTNQETDIGGASAVNDAVNGAPSLNITTTRANSIIVCITSDRNGVDGASRAYRDSATEAAYQFPGGFTCYHYYKAAASVTTYTEGLTAPAAGMQSGTALYEIRQNL